MTETAEKTTQNPARGRGRPRSEEKRQDILQAAMELFTNNGFDGTSVDEIAATAGVSKQTVYSNFGNKENLFGVAVTAKCKSSGIDSGAIDHSVPPDLMLPEIARRFLTLMTSPEAVGVHAVCTGSAETHPDLGEVYFKRGPLDTVAAIAAYLEAQDRAGLLRIDNAEHAAWQFLCMLKAEDVMRAQFNLDRVDDKALQDYIESCIRVFMSAYGPEVA